MQPYRLSKLADADIVELADFTIGQFGIKQARRYCDGLEKMFDRIAEYPNCGRSAEHLHPKLRRINFESHVIFFLREENRVKIVRILHQRMAPDRHRMMDEEF